MVRTIPRLASILLTLLALNARHADACSCVQQGPACQAFWKTDAVFDATVDSIASTPRQQVYGNSPPITVGEYLVKLRVRQAWKGVQTGALEVVTSDPDSMCGFNFKVGTRYLVFAWKRPLDGRWSVSICSLTQEYDGTGESAAFFASLSAPPRGGRVFGSVNASERVFEMDRPSPDRPVQTRVRLSGGGEERSTLSTDGRFEFTGLEPGAYRLDLEVPGGYSTYAERRDVQLPNRQSCAREDYWLLPAGRITGHVVGPDGRPLVDVKVETTAADARSHPMHGPFHGVGNHRRGWPLRDSRASGRQVRRWPAAGLFVGAWDRTGNPTQFARGAGGAKSGADGRFVIELRQGRVYTFSVVDGDDRQAILAVAAPRIETTGPVGPIRIVIRGDRQGRRAPVPFVT